MRIRIAVLFTLVFLCVAPLVAAQDDNTGGQSLGNIARQLRQDKQRGAQAGNATTQPSQAQTGESLADAARRVREKRETEWIVDPAEGVERMYESSVRSLFDHQDFKALDEAASQVRSDKSRLPGGIWKLNALYEAVSMPQNGDSASPSAWQAHIGVLKRWVAERPQSVTARIALAEGYVRFAQNARGYGYADTVSDNAWQSYGELLRAAGETLLEAYKLREKCPHWYLAMQHVGLGVGMEPQQMRALFEKAIAFEPSYYHYYRDYANSILPRWNGEHGEVEQFAEESFKRVGGKDGAFLYFEIATIIYCNCGEQTPLTLSWPRIKAGYDAMAAAYGTTNVKRNRLASLAVLAGDRTVAHDMFAQIGESWDKDTWRTRKYFETARDWSH